MPRAQPLAPSGRHTRLGGDQEVERSAGRCTRGSSPPTGRTPRRPRSRPDGRDAGADRRPRAQLLEPAVAQVDGDRLVGMGEQQDDDLVGQLARALRRGTRARRAAAGTCPSTSAVVTRPGSMVPAGVTAARGAGLSPRRPQPRAPADHRQRDEHELERRGQGQALVQVERDVRHVHAEDPDRPVVDVLAREQQLGDEAQDRRRGVRVGHGRVRRGVEERPERRASRRRRRTRARARRRFGANVTRSSSASVRHSASPPAVAPSTT